MKKITVVSLVVVILLGLFIAYQLLRVILGGSWNAEDIIITLLVFNSGLVFTMGLALMGLKSSLSGLRSDHKHLSNQFKALASDFKEHLRKH